MAFLLVCCIASPADAATKSKKKKKARPAAHRIAPVAREAAYADLVIEAHTGRILHETNSESIRHPASLTKMMTLYLAFQAIEGGVVRLDTLLPVSAKAAAQSPSKLGLQTGQSVRVYDAIMGLVTQSANDAAVVLAEALGGSTEQFAQMMVDQARALGMRRTIFENPNGLPDPDQVTTAKDMAILGLALIYHYPGFYPYFGQNSFVYKGRSYNNHNNLMKRYPGMDGIKTGYIRSSGFNLVASAVRGETRLVAVIFGGKSAAGRDAQMEGLLDQAFAQVDAPVDDQAQYIAMPSKVAAAFSPRRSAQRTSRYVDPERPTIIEGQGRVSNYGAWGIQVGAYSDVASAQRALDSMSRSMDSLLVEAEQSLQKVTVADGTAMYRARFTGLDQASARSACSYLIKRGQSCLVISGP